MRYRVAKWRRLELIMYEVSERTPLRLDMMREREMNGGECRVGLDICKEEITSVYGVTIFSMGISTEMEYK